MLSISNLIFDDYFPLLTGDGSFNIVRAVTIQICNFALVSIGDSIIMIIPQLSIFFLT